MHAPHRRFALSFATDTRAGGPGRPSGRWRVWAALLATVATLTACASLEPQTPASPTAWPARLAALLPTEVLLLGEQHDAPEHQRLQRDTVLWLAARGQLAAVVMEMAEQGHSTAALPRDATEAQAQANLQWNDTAWPWKAYGPVVMAAVGAGLPVLGGNLPRADMRAAMGETRWDQHLPTAALQRQYEALREGHCGLLPASQIAPMARIQIARDASLARTAQAARKSGRTVLLIAGGGHVLRSVGVPTHWPTDLRSKVALAQSGQARAAIKNDAKGGGGVNADGDTDELIETPALPPSDACAELRAKWRPAPSKHP
ncbi:MAG: hypothetical protein EOO29_18605 [Comamonadaceae bacterium]|nr:MAG: hypothetical protein EOO29_18605 [Comamonadaceae bacterium]